MNSPEKDLVANPRVESAKEVANSSAGRRGLPKAGRGRKKKKAS